MSDGAATRVLLETEEIVAVDKPAGRPTIPGRGDIGEPVSAELERRLGRKLFVVHRLDRDAGGVLVFAKTAPAHKRLSAAFEGREARKTYLALVLGRPGESGEIDLPLRQFGSGRWGAAAPGEGKPSLTRWRRLAEGEGCALLEARPLTGRRHQLRAHLYSIGHPILGDRLYGEDRPVGGAPRLMLHALTLSLPGCPPLSCPPPDDFRAVLASRGVPDGFELF
jgi:RluA family pseudouridine synthase